jgi:hypothetical protein
MKQRTLVAEIYTIWGTRHRALRLSYRGRGLLDTLKPETDKEREQRAHDYAKAHGFTRVRWAFVQ